MADFEQLKQQQDEVRNASLQSARAKERERTLLAQAAELRRSTGSDDPHAQAEINRLEALAKRAGSERRRALEELNAGKGRLDGLWADLLPLTDPTERISGWSDRTPILLFPVRLETRFKKVAVPGANNLTDQLWLRIYPDDCLVDTFEEDLMEQERKNARRYWAMHWAAAGDEAKQRAAWRELVASHGSGRSGYVIANYQPLNPAEAPSEPAVPGEFHLVIPAQVNEPLGADADAVANFWKAVFAKQESKNNASELAKKYQPANLDATVAEGTTVKVTYVRFPEFGTEDSKPFSWSEAPKAKLLPERFVFLGFQGNNPNPTVTKIGNLVKGPLPVGPNPSATQEEQFAPDADGDLIVPEELRWMTDFEEAEVKGMAIRIPLDTVTALRGFDRVLVLGVRLGSNQQQGRDELNELLNHHLFGRSGFAIVPQGTPTNNTEDTNSGYSRADDPDESFPIFVKQRTQFDYTADDRQKTDGQRLAEALGLPFKLLQHTPNADQRDRAEAMAMNDALFPATMGYWMQKLMNPVFKNERLMVERTRQFFTDHVSGRGALPAIRVGRQPYGIQLATAYSKAAWLPSSNTAVANNFQRDGYLRELYELLMKLDAKWKEMAQNVPHVGRPSDNPQQQLLDIVDLHPASVEYHARHSMSVFFLYNYFYFTGISFGLWADLIRMFFLMAAEQLLRQLGYQGRELPKLFEHYHTDGQNRLNGPIVDDRPASEKDLIRSYTADNKNYIQWLAEAVSDYDDKLLPQAGLAERPRALLYLLLRHAIIEAYDNAGHQARLDAKVVEPATYFNNIAVEPNFLHIKAEAQSESRFAHLLATEPAVTGNGVPLGRFLGQEVAKQVSVVPAVHALKRMKADLETLQNLPTARLERLLAEHVDCCTYRHDAWVQGFMDLQLSLLRSNLGDDAPIEGEEEEFEGSGVFLGAFGWIENLRPEGKQPQPVQLDRELTKVFQRPGDLPLTSDDTNHGYIHAPSLNHAVTAAVLRNGYLSNATPTQPDLLAINLSSERVRKAMETLEGIRNGQSLGALLGYRFERSLHDADPAMFVFSYQLRKAFPLVANRLANTRDTDPAAQEAIAARNVVDGYAVVKKALANGNTPNFSFLTTALTDPVPSGAQRAIIENVIKDLIDIHDALSDLSIAESVHQVTQGNYDRAAANLDAYSNATFPQTPDVVITPRSGTTLTHRVGIQLDSQAVAQPADNPRTRAEPSLAKWMENILPNMSGIAVLVEVQNPGDPAPPMLPFVLTLQQLGLQPLDLLYMLDFDSDAALGALDELLLKFVLAQPGVHANAKVTIQYTLPVVQAGIVATIFEVAPLLRSLRQIVLGSRPLLASDLAQPTEASTIHTSFIDKARIQNVLPNTAPLDALDADLANPALGIDQKIDGLADTFRQIGLYGVAESGFGFAYQWKNGQYAALLKKLEERIDNWNKKLAEFDDIMANEVPIAASDEDKISSLRKAEALVSSEFIAPLPALIQYETDVVQKGVVFGQKRDALENLWKNPPATLQQFYDDVQAELPLSQLDPVAFHLDDEQAEVQRFVQKMAEQASALKANLLARNAQANDRIVEYDDPSTKPERRSEAMKEAGKVLFGEDFLLIAHFDVATAQAQEWQNSLAAKNQVLAFQTAKGDDFPVDTWFYGSARVREKLAHLENAMMLAEGFKPGMASLEILPTQFPFRNWTPDPIANPGIEEPEPWLALEWPAAYKVTEEKLLYSAHYATAFNPATRQCGLLLDEWTEVVPAREETTGLAFHYDRPNNEPPQAWLLAMAPTIGRNWTWEALVQAIQETLDLAKQRAVEPAQVEATPLGVFSPATVFPVTPWAITPSLNLNFVNKQVLTF